MRKSQLIEEQKRHQNQNETNGVFIKDIMVDIKNIMVKEILADEAFLKEEGDKI